MNFIPVPALGFSHCSQGQHLRAEIHGFGGTFLWFWKVVRGRPSSCKRTGAEVSQRDGVSPNPNILSTVEKESAYFVSEMNKKKTSQLDGFQKTLPADVFGGHLAR